MDLRDAAEAAEAVRRERERERRVLAAQQRIANTRNRVVEYVSERLGLRITVRDVDLYLTWATTPGDLHGGIVVDGARLVLYDHTGGQEPKRLTRLSVGIECAEYEKVLHSLYSARTISDMAELGRVLEKGTIRFLALNGRVRCSCGDDGSGERVYRIGGGFV